jgi:hypothetical protein
MESWAALRAWYDLVWNSQNGQLFYKSDIIGTIIVNQHDKKGIVLRRVTLHNCQIKQVGAINLQWSSSEIWNEVQADFVADYWTDEYFDEKRNREVTAPTITEGYNPIQVP